MDSFHALVRAPGNPAYAALGSLLGPPLGTAEAEYLQCCEVAAGVLIGLMPAQRRVFREQLLRTGSRQQLQLALLLRALQPWLVAKPGVALRQWCEGSGAVISRVLVALLEAAGQQARMLLSTGLGSSGWMRGGVRVDLSTALRDLLDCTGGAHSSHTTHTAERALCGARCACALAHPLQPLLAVPRRKQGEVGRGLAPGLGCDEESSGFAEHSLHLRSVAVVAEHGLFSQHAAHPPPHTEIPPYHRREEGEGGYYALTLSLLQKGMQAVAALGELNATSSVPPALAPRLPPYAGLWGMDGSETACSAGNSSSASSAGSEACSLGLDRGELCANSSLSLRRAIALRALACAWQALLNAVGRALTSACSPGVQLHPARNAAPSQTPASSAFSSSQAPSQWVASQLPLTNDEGSSQMSGGEHYVCVSLLLCVCVCVCVCVCLAAFSLHPICPHLSIPANSYSPYSIIFAHARTGTHAKTRSW